MFDWCQMEEGSGACGEGWKSRHWCQEKHNGHSFPHLVCSAVAPGCVWAVQSAPVWLENGCGGVGGAPLTSDGWLFMAQMRIWVHGHWHPRVWTFTHTHTHHANTSSRMLSVPWPNLRRKPPFPMRGSRRLHDWQLHRGAHLSHLACGMCSGWDQRQCTKSSCVGTHMWLCIPGVVG